MAKRQFEDIRPFQHMTHDMKIFHCITFHYTYTVFLCIIDIFFLGII